MSFPSIIKWKRRSRGRRGEMTQALYAHMNNKTIKNYKMGVINI
jgi:hypothetical protein